MSFLVWQVYVRSHLSVGGIVAVVCIHHQTVLPPPTLLFLGYPHLSPSHLPHLLSLHQHQGIQKGLQVNVHHPLGMIWDDAEGGKPEFGDSAIYFCEDVSSMGGLMYYYHQSYPSGWSFCQGTPLRMNCEQEQGHWERTGRRGSC
jgi:hypothetical protein